MSVNIKVEEICKRTKSAYPSISKAKTAQKNKVLESLSRLIYENAGVII